jgi:hypothetical protein
MLTHLLNVVQSIVREKISKPWKRSSRWPEVRWAYLQVNPKCEACGSDKHIQVHHKVPFSDAPELELDPSNFISLCMGPNECHLAIGHGDNFKMFNPNIVEDAKAVKADPTKIKEIAIKAKKARLDTPPKKVEVKAEAAPVEVKKNEEATASHPTVVTDGATASHPVIPPAPAIPVPAKKTRKKNATDKGVSS